MKVTARPATPHDIDALLRLYRSLEEEQVALKAMWQYADGLAEPAAAALEQIMEDDDSILLVGEIDDVPFGFVWARSESMLPQADDRRVGVVRLLFTDHEARGVGIGETMIASVLAELRAKGHTLFDARVLPGHRNAKNFFEAQGFSARLIIMHHDDADG